jgi:GTP cyclohydrolase IA
MARSFDRLALAADVTSPRSRPVLHAECGAGCTDAPLRPARHEAEAALRTLLAWLGEDPRREGLRETPDRVLRAYGEYFAGYAQDPVLILQKSFDELDGYQGPVVVRDIEVHSHCEHHMVPFTGVAHVAYLPRGRVVGLSKIARLVDAFAKRLQIQERLTAQIAQSLFTELDARAVAVVIACEHQCMATRGVRKHGANTITTQVLGLWEEHASARAEVLQQLRVD